MAPSPSRSGISRSIRTRSGSRSCTFCSASMPLRAVATARKSPLPSTTSLNSRRKKALSSTIRTLRAIRESGCHATPTRLRPVHRPPTASRSARNRRRWPGPRWARRAGSAPGGRPPMFRSPIWIVPGAASDANMLAPPARRAVTRRVLAPSGLMSSSSRGIAVCGNLAGLSSFRLSAGDGSSTCASPPTLAVASCSTTATQLPSPIVTRTSWFEPTRRSATRTRSSPFTRAAGRRARADPRESDDRGPGRTGSPLCPAPGNRRGPAPGRTSGTGAPAWGGRSRSRRFGTG